MGVLFQEALCNNQVVSSFMKPIGLHGLYHWLLILKDGNDPDIAGFDCRFKL
jgi:hypothetical protein